MVVSCRSCNSRKGLRTPDAAGLSLVEPRSAPRYDHESDDESNLSADPVPDQEQEQEQESEQEPESDQARTTKTRIKVTRGVRLPTDWHPTGPETIAGVVAQFGITPEEVADEVDKFRDYWCAVTGQRGVKLDWDATFRNRLREQAGRGYIGGHWPDKPAAAAPLKPWFGIGQEETKAT